jgi:hypothetical protein
VLSKDLSKITGKEYFPTQYLTKDDIHAARSQSKKCRLCNLGLGHTWKEHDWLTEYELMYEAEILAYKEDKKRKGMGK